MACVVLVLLAVACGAAMAKTETHHTDFLMPGVKPEKAETYLCTAMELDDKNEHYLVGFEPHSTMQIAHHILLFGCSEPGSDKKVWNCGEMKGKMGGSPCGKNGVTEIIYAWAKNAPKLDLPEGVGFKVGGASSKKYLVLQVHYMHAMDTPDESGISVISTKERMPKNAAVLLMATGGGMAAHENEHFETACIIDEDIVMHPFAFRTHTHKHGKVVSGWKVQRNEEGEDSWQLIGKKSPQVEQMFYPVNDKSMVLEAGDVVAARCTMNNEKGDEDVMIGATNADEMCNFYIMYWVDGDRLLTDNNCVSSGPPGYHWATEGGLKNIPEKEADSL